MDKKQITKEQLNELDDRELAQATGKFEIVISKNIKINLPVIMKPKLNFWEEK